MKRREILATAGIAFAVPSEGCLGRLGGSGGDDEDPDGGQRQNGDGGDDADEASIDGRLHNEADEPKTFGIRVYDQNEETVAEDQVSVEADSTERVPAFGAPGSPRTYEVVVGESRATETLEFDVESSPERVDGYVDVTYAGDGIIEIEFTARDDDETGEHHLYIVNLDGEARRVELAVLRRGGDDELGIEGTYDVPDERGVEFRDVAAWGETYEVTATIESGVSKTFDWEIESCAEPETSSGSRNGSVRIERGGDGLSFVTDSCDAITAGSEVPTGPASYFEVDETETR